MKIKLKKDIFMSKFGVVFPKDVEMDTVVYSHKRMIIHPTIKGVLTNLPKKSKYILVVSK